MEHNRIVTQQQIKKFRKLLSQNEKSKNTIEKYVRDILKFQEFMAGENVTKNKVLAYKSHLEHCGKYKTSSINSFLAALNCFCRCMSWEDLCVKTIKVQKNLFEPEERELTRQEYEMLIQAAMQSGDEQTALIVETIGSTGIRIGELCYISVECLDGGVAKISNKGKVRDIFLPDSLTHVLRAYVAKSGISSGSIFLNTKQQPIHRKTVWRHMKRAAEIAGVPAGKVFPHNLRHLFAKEFYKLSGGDMMKLADILGHSNLATTRLYIKTTGREHKQQLDKMNMVVSRSTASVPSPAKQPHQNAVAVGRQERLALLEALTSHSELIQTNVVEGICEIKIKIPLEEIFTTAL